jgi:hypothetical protein
MKDRFQTSFIIDKKLWIKFKSKTVEEGVFMKDALHTIIDKYVKEKKSASSWFHLPRW